MYRDLHILEVLPIWCLAELLWNVYKTLGKGFGASNQPLDLEQRCLDFLSYSITKGVPPVKINMSPRRKVVFQHLPSFLIRRFSRWGGCPSTLIQVTRPKPIRLHIPQEDSFQRQLMRVVERRSSKKHGFCTEKRCET